MNQNVSENDLFDESNMIKGNWAKFDKVGDQIKGTYVGSKIVFDRLRNADKTVYELQLDNGEIWNVGSKPAIDEQMRHVKLGQIIGFKFIAEGKPAKPGLNPAKIIKVFARQDLVNKEWLEQNEMASMGGAGYTPNTSGGSVYTPNTSVDPSDNSNTGDLAAAPNQNSGGFSEDGTIPELADEEEPFESGTQQSAPTPAQDDNNYSAKKMVIDGLAKIKLNIQNSADLEKIIPEKLGLAFVEANYDDIIKKLEAI